MVSLVQRMRKKRTAEDISIRHLADLTGVAWSTIARVERGEGRFNAESARRISAWLGDDVSGVVSADQRKKAEEIGRIMARACAAEILKIISEANN